MFSAEVTAFLETGCALIVGTVGTDREPHATRGWGLDVLSADEGTIRLLLDAGDVVGLDHLTVVGDIAITAADVRTLRSVQLKGHASAIAPATPDDQKRARRFCDAFFLDILETDGTPLHILERLVPEGYVACTVAVDEIYDQTPGPGAGAPLGGQAA